MNIKKIIFIKIFFLVSSFHVCLGMISKPDDQINYHKNIMEQNLKNKTIKPSFDKKIEESYTKLKVDSLKMIDENKRKNQIDTAKLYELIGSWQAIEEICGKFATNPEDDLMSDDEEDKAFKKNLRDQKATERKETYGTYVKVAEKALTKLNEIKSEIEQQQANKSSDQDQNQDETNKLSQKDRALLAKLKLVLAEEQELISKIQNLLGEDTTKLIDLNKELSLKQKKKKEIENERLELEKQIATAVVDPSNLDPGNFEKLSNVVGDNQEKPKEILEKPVDVHLDEREEEIKEKDDQEKKEKEYDNTQTILFTPLSEVSEQLNSLNKPVDHLVVEFKNKEKQHQIEFYKKFDNSFFVLLVEQIKFVDPELLTIRIDGIFLKNQKEAKTPFEEIVVRVLQHKKEKLKKIKIELFEPTDLSSLIPILENTPKDINTEIYIIDRYRHQSNTFIVPVFIKFIESLIESKIFEQRELNKNKTIYCIFASNIEGNDIKKILELLVNFLNLDWLTIDIEHWKIGFRDFKALENLLKRGMRVTKYTDSGLHVSGFYLPPFIINNELEELVRMLEQYAIENLNLKKQYNKKSFPEESYTMALESINEYYANKQEFIRMISPSPESFNKKIIVLKEEYKNVLQVLDDAKNGTIKNYQKAIRTISKVYNTQINPNVLKDCKLSNSFENLKPNNEIDFIILDPGIKHAENVRHIAIQSHPEHFILKNSPRTILTSDDYIRAILYGPDHYTTIGKKTLLNSSFSSTNGETFLRILTELKINNRDYINILSVGNIYLNGLDDSSQPVVDYRTQWLPLYGELSQIKGYSHLKEIQNQIETTRKLRKNNVYCVNISRENVLGSGSNFPWLLVQQKVIESLVKEKIVDDAAKETVSLFGEFLLTKTKRDDEGKTTDTDRVSGTSVSAPGVSGIIDYASKVFGGFSMQQYKQALLRSAKTEFSLPSHRKIKWSFGERPTNKIGALVFDKRLDYYQRAFGINEKNYEERANLFAYVYDDRIGKPEKMYPRLIYVPFSSLSHLYGRGIANLDRMLLYLQLLHLRSKLTASTKEINEHEKLQKILNLDREFLPTTEEIHNKIDPFIPYLYRKYWVIKNKKNIVIYKKILKMVKDFIIESSNFEWIDKEIHIVEQNFAKVTKEIEAIDFYDKYKSTGGFFRTSSSNLQKQEQEQRQRQKKSSKLKSYFLPYPQSKEKSTPKGGGFNCP
jgi:hypothetical protein